MAGRQVLKIERLDVHQKRQLSLLTPFETSSASKMLLITLGEFPRDTV